MVQDGKSQEIEETDGLPFPQRIWAVVAIGFALCMSVLDINISTVLDCQWLSIGYCSVITFFFCIRRNLRIS